jgi:hypothetical protein
VEKPGWIDGEVRLTPDRLAADDVFYFPLKVHEKVKALVVDGDPKTSLKAGESYYLVSALNPGGGERSPFTVRVIAENEMAVSISPATMPSFFSTLPDPIFPGWPLFSKPGGRSLFSWETGSFPRRTIVFRWLPGRFRK